MIPNLDKYPDQSRGLLLGLLTNCVFSTIDDDSCPLFELRNSLSIEQKYDFVMGLGKEELTFMLRQHEGCFEKKFTSEFKMVE